MMTKTKKTIAAIVVIGAALFIPIRQVEITPIVELIVHGCDGSAVSSVRVTLKSASPYEFLGHYEERISDSDGRVYFERRVKFVSISRLIIVKFIDAMSIINPHVDTRIRSAVFFKDLGSGYVSFLDGEKPPDRLRYCDEL